MGSLIISDCTLIDCTGKDPRHHAWVRVEGDRVVQLGVGAPPKVRDALHVDAAGRVVMPGLIDAHAHLSYIDNHVDSWNGPAPVYALKIGREIEETLADGFTTIRDAGGLDWGYKEAIARGVLRGPRLFVSNGTLSQTGGHGDLRPRTQLQPDLQLPGVWRLGIVVDGPDQVRWGTREMLRRGADQIKVMANGGCMSPTDKLETLQFTTAELRAAVEEADAQGTYVMAHTYLPDSMGRCMDAGIRTLEHGNLMSPQTAERMAQTGTYMVSTITTFELLAAEGRAHYPSDQIDKIDRVLQGAYKALAMAREAGVRIGSGSDVLGFHQRKKALELQFKSKVLTPMEVLISTTATNAEIVRCEKELGTVEEGKLADLLLVDGDPLQDLSVLAHRDRIHLVILGGEIVADRRPRG